MDMRVDSVTHAHKHKGTSPTTATGKRKVSGEEFSDNESSPLQ